MAMVGRRFYYKFQVHSKHELKSEICSMCCNLFFSLSMNCLFDWLTKPIKPHIHAYTHCIDIVTFMSSQTYTYAHVCAALVMYYVSVRFCVGNVCVCSQMTGV